MTNDRYTKIINWFESATEQERAEMLQTFVSIGPDAFSEAISQETPEKLMFLLHCIEQYEVAEGEKMFQLINDELESRRYYDN